ncbi:DUF3298 and DUF4163 domain-containing protein [Desulfosporosinus hippei]|uniref:DUF3298 domain-containing protein n=1 Tax=Desulfosporosinus hippei DSM 8344 TaxID=1121419 RepID=A0A1G7WAS2_9FIRM|nr:DUF3298 and DUF4163 domain-containing protein [Desulfosporosinus hippei]SDG68180.1 Protein of unknown function [Desulfosporosinus hippei DSM 8344]
MGKTRIFLLKSLIGLLMLGLILTGCGTKEANNQPSSSGDTSQQDRAMTALVIERKVHTEAYRDDQDGSVLLYLKITYPEIRNPENNPGISKINEYYSKQCDSFLGNALGDGLEMARADKEVALSGGFEFRPHAYERSTEIYYNGNDLLSVVNLVYENTGGAHPNSGWLSETFDVKTGMRLTLADILGGSSEEALEKVYQTVLAKIKETEGTENFVYQENYADNVRRSYSEDDFVLTSNSLMVYYQPYAIAAYVAGIPKFDLPYSQMKTPPLNIPTLPNSQLERDLYSQVGYLLERNKEAFYEIFGLSMLPMDIPEKRGDNEVLFPVIDRRFVNYADFEQFVRGTYIRSEADLLLSNGKYQNVEGKLYGDISKDAGLGYYVNWNDYSYVLETINETSAKLTIFTTDDSPAGKKNMTITVGLQEVNGVWLLEKVVE